MLRDGGDDHTHASTIGADTHQSLNGPAGDEIVALHRLIRSIDLVSQVVGASCKGRSPISGTPFARACTAATHESPALAIFAGHTSHMRSRRRALSRQPHAGLLLMAALGFILVPALAAFAGSGKVLSSRRAEAAYARKAPELTGALAEQGLSLGSPVYLRLTKSPAELTAFVADGQGIYRRFRAWPVCAVSGGLGPKLREGDGQAPEGFYRVTPAAMNPASNYHLSFNLGYPNAFDRAHGRTGSFLMVHGGCVSIGCFAMTDDGIEEIWTLMEAAFENGQPAIDVHIFPFPMTETAIKSVAGNPHAEFWASLAPAWTAFEETGVPPEIRVSGKHYRIGGAQKGETGTLR